MSQVNIDNAYILWYLYNMAKELRFRLKKEELKKLYLDEKKSLEDIARLYGVSRVAVWKYCRSMRLTRRSRSEARLESQKRGKVLQNCCDVDEHFFSKWTPEMAYILGLLMTNGCLNKTQKIPCAIKLGLNDKVLLDKIAKVMCSNYQAITSSYPEGLHMFMFGHEKLIEDLTKLGFKPRKGLDFKFPDVPEEHLTDFIRGVFDGDGSVFFDKKSTKFPLRAKFINGSKTLMENLEKRLKLLGMPKRNIYQHKTKNGMLYMFKYAHQDCIKLFKILYKNALKNGLFLVRKYDKFLEGFTREV